MIPTTEQIGTFDLDTWHLVPAETNPEGHESGSWAIAGGDDDEYDLFIEIADAEYPRQVAEFVLAAVQQHATRLRLGAVADDALAARERLLADGCDAVLINESSPRRVMELIGRIGQLAAELAGARAPVQSSERMVRMYGQVAEVTAIALAWMEAICAHHDVPRRQAS
ncbi:hypothetical protein [Planobispora rosea]|uniref:hypothetical protein n=1 Tax=Planobispora rosea TaxID=35762 RepID=UPI00083AEA34|nr:hypothetical protein [Planobispora rosea]